MLATKASISQQKPVLVPQGSHRRKTRVTSAPSAISKDSISDRVRQELIDRVLDGRLAPGMRLIEIDIAREFGTSQSPVREALKQLAGMGVVTSSAYRSTVVREVTLEEVLDVDAIRSSLEPLGSKGLASCSEVELDGLRDIADAMVRACKQKDVLGYTLHHLAFHRAVIQFAHNDILLRIWDSMAFEVRATARMKGEHLRPAEVERVYTEILDAAAQGDEGTLHNLLLQRLAMPKRGFETSQARRKKQARSREQA